MKKLILLSLLFLGCKGERQLQGKLYWAQVDSVEVVYRYGGDKAHIHWKSREVDFVQVIELKDTADYRVGFKMLVLDIQ